METKHTPGPWIIDHDSSDTRADQWYIVGPARVHFGYNDSVEAQVAKADAQLIAASPDLLEALMLAVKEEERSRAVMIRASKEMGFDEPKKLAWVVKAEAAIAKATQP